ncbi:MAG: FlhC family transcriptional regulator [Methylomonas sp.]
MNRITMDRSFMPGHTLVTAERLIKWGARPPVISRLCQLTPKQSVRLYKWISGYSPKQGMLPYDDNWIIRSANNNIHASLFLGIIQDLKQLLSLSVISADQFLVAYTLYANVMCKNQHAQRHMAVSTSRSLSLDINRAWYLIGQLSAGELVFNHCDKCHVRYLGLYQQQIFSQCPICEVKTDRSGRRRWISIKSKSKRNK